MTALTLKLFLESCFFIFANTRNARGFEPELEDWIGGESKWEGDEEEDEGGAESRDDDGVDRPWLDK